MASGSNCLAQGVSMAKEFGLNPLLLRVLFGGQTDEKVWRQLEVLGLALMPELFLSQSLKAFCLMSVWIRGLVTIPSLC